METNENIREKAREQAQTAAVDGSVQTAAPAAAPVHTQAEAERRPAGSRKNGKRPGDRPRRPTAQADRPRRPAEKARTERVERPAGEQKRANPEKREKRPADGQRPNRPPEKKKIKKKPTDSQYQPYKAAKERQKAQKASQMKQFFTRDNPVAKLYNRLTDKGDVFANDSELARKRKEQRAAEAAKKKKNGFGAPAVIYTQPQAFNRDRLLVQLLSIVAVVLAFVLGLSVFFKVKTITISGAEVYSPWAVREASGIKEGDNLLTFGRARASGQITANLPYVKSVRIGIKLPDTVNIEIDEEDVVYAIKSEEGIWWLINSGGKVVEMSNNSKAKNYTQVLGVTLSAPEVNQIGLAADDIPTETDADGEFIPVTVTGAQRLNAALQILKAMEANDLVGEAASVDVSRMEDIILWYGSRYQVNLGSVDRMDYKIACMCDAILQMSDYQTGVLDISFTTWSDQVGYTPFQ